MGKTLIYHGSYAKIRMPKILVGRNTKDFGFGFFLHGKRFEVSAL